MGNPCSVLPGQLSQLAIGSMFGAKSIASIVLVAMTRMAMVCLLNQLFPVLFVAFDSFTGFVVVNISV